jgi:beta-galactosidase
MLLSYGMKWITPAGLEFITYYGRGPHENYQDRNYSAPVGIYKQTVNEQYTAYTRPQETGNKTDIRWFRLLDGQGKGLEVVANGLLSMSALHYYDEDLDDGDKKDQRHAGELRSRKQTQLNIDLVQMGLGSITSWGSLPMRPYLMPYKNYSYAFTVRPVNE